MYGHSTAVGTNQSELSQLNKLQTQIRVLNTSPDQQPSSADQEDNAEYLLGLGNKYLVGWVDMIGEDANGAPSRAPHYGPANFLGLGPKAGDVTRQFP